ncbi:MAG: substrate-binding domain-containing protein, partial [Sphaerochaetaceae bacterium]|nr:substrate-binding domain-containing protein [Sphaerochaetaceae bacterium]
KLVFPRDDTMALGFYNACVRYKIRVPEDVSIMGFGNFYCAKSTPKVLTTFNRRFDEVISKAVEVYDKLQISRGNGVCLPNSEKKIFVKGEMVEGETILDIN